MPLAAEPLSKVVGKTEIEGNDCHTAESAEARGVERHDEVQAAKSVSCLGQKQQTADKAGLITSNQDAL